MALNQVVNPEVVDLYNFVRISRALELSTTLIQRGIDLKHRAVSND